MVLYIAFVFWSIVAIFSARAVYNLLVQVLPAKAVNYLLLPGTLIAQIGHHLALLVTGETISQSRLANDSTGEPEVHSDAKPKVPIIGPVLVSVLPMFLCGLALFLLADHLSFRGMVRSGEPLPQGLPVPVLSVFSVIDNVFRLAAGTLDVVRDMLRGWSRLNWGDWQTWLFAYLTLCLAIRMSPIPSDLRPALLGILMFGVLCAVLGWFSSQPAAWLRGFWDNLSFLVGNLLLLLLIALTIAGLTGFYKILKGGAPAGGGGGPRPAGKPAGKPA